MNLQAIAQGILIGSLLLLCIALYLKDAGRAERRRIERSKPHVWITINGYPFYVPLDAPEVELAYGHIAAQRMRREAGLA